MNAQYTLSAVALPSNRLASLACVKAPAAQLLNLTALCAGSFASSLPQLVPAEVADDSKRQESKGDEKKAAGMPVYLAVPLRLM